MAGNELVIVLTCQVLLVVVNSSGWTSLRSKNCIDLESL